MPTFDTTVTAPKGGAVWPEWVWRDVGILLVQARVLLPKGAPRWAPLRDMLGRVTGARRLSDVPVGRSGHTVPCWRVTGLWALHVDDPIIGLIDSGDALLDLAIDLKRDLTAQDVIYGVERVVLYARPAPPPRVGFLQPTNGVTV